MSLTQKPIYIKEPTSLQCGQAVLAMLTDLSVSEIIAQCGTERETTLAQIKTVLKNNGISFEEERKAANTKEDLPPVALLSLETPRCWHWSLYFKGKFYDPEHGVLDEFPEAKRKYYWKING